MRSMGMCRVRVLMSLVAVLTVAVVPSALARPSAGAIRAGCALRRAIAYGPDGLPLAHQPPRAPTPCLVATGYPTVEARVGVTNHGAVIQEPAIVTSGPLATVSGVAGASSLPAAGPLPAPATVMYDFGLAGNKSGIVVSSDEGGTWSLIPPGGDYGGTQDNAMYVDPRTGRLFLEWLTTPPPVPPQTGGQVPLQDQTFTGRSYMMASPDDGKTWLYSSVPGFVLTENPRFTSAPAPAGQPSPVGYEDVTYWCANTNVGASQPQFILGRECYRSLDGGGTWELRSVLASKAPAPECGSNQPYYGALDGNYPEGADDGSLYVMVTCSNSSDNPLAAYSPGSVYVARSVDEAGSWTTLREPTADGVSNAPLPVPAGATHAELRVTTVNGEVVLVLVYDLITANGPEVQARTATDPGSAVGGVLSEPLRWTDPVNLAPSGLPTLDRWAVQVRGSELALSFIAGRSNGSSTVYDGYITLVDDITAPVMWTATVNDPSRPLSLEASEDARDDFIDVTIGPDGTPWASFFSPCDAKPDAATDPACTGPQGGPDRGLVGSFRLDRQ